MPEVESILAHSAAEYIAFDPFLDTDRDVQNPRCRTIKIVKTRSPQICVSLSSGSHEIPAGTMARFEKAYIPHVEAFGSYYLCFECCNKEMTPGFWAAEPGGGK